MNFAWAVCLVPVCMENDIMEISPMFVWLAGYSAHKTRADLHTKFPLLLSDFKES
jgi:hypothetical protein